MDHIAKALERARSERGTARNWLLSTPASEPIGSVPSVSTLRSVALSREHLSANFVLAGRGVEDPVVHDRYRLLRTLVVQRMRQEGWRTVGISSPGPRAGKSLTAINLAITTARDGAHQVVLVDADMRRPSVAETLGLPKGPGLIDYLSSSAELSDVLVRTDIENLTLLPGRREGTGKAVPELLTSNKMVGLFDALQRSGASDLTVIDLPPLLVGDDVVAIAPLVDCLLLVIEEGKTTVDELTKAAELIPPAKLLGTVLNKSADRTKEYEYYYSPPATADSE